MLLVGMGESVSVTGRAQWTALDFYKIAIPASSVAYAIEQPDDVDINEIVLRPTAQDF